MRPNGVPIRRGYAERVPDRQPHVGHAQLGDRGSVAELGHRVHDRLRMDDHLDPVVVDAEQLVGLDHLEPLVHERARVDRDLGSHRPRRVGERLGDRDVRQLVGGAAAERPAAGRDDDPRHLADGARSQALVDRAVLAVDGDQLGARCRPQRLDHRTGGDQALLVGEPEPLPARSVSIVTGRPAKPTTPLITTSASSTTSA